MQQISNIENIQQEENSIPNQQSYQQIPTSNQSILQEEKITYQQLQRRCLTLNISYSSDNNRAEPSSNTVQRKKNLVLKVIFLEDEKTDQEFEEIYKDFQQLSAKFLRQRKISSNKLRKQKPTRLEFNNFTNIYPVVLEELFPKKAEQILMRKQQSYKFTDIKKFYQSLKIYEKSVMISYLNRIQTKQVPHLNVVTIKEAGILKTKLQKLR